MTTEEQKRMYTTAVADAFRGRFEFKDTDGNWQICHGALPENCPGREYRYLTQQEVTEAERPKPYDKNYFLEKMKGSCTCWVRVNGCKDMLLVMGVQPDGLLVGSVGFKSWERLAEQSWQWTQYHYVTSYEDLKWNNFVRSNSRNR